MRAYSYSALTLFEGCPLSWKLKYLDRVPEEPSRPMQVGAAAHAAIEIYLEQLAGAGIPSDAGIIPAVLDDTRVDGKTPIAAALREEVAGLLYKFAETFAFDPKEGRPDLEAKLAFDAKWRPVAWFSRKPPVRFRAVTDWRAVKGDTVRIRDWKTGFKIEPTSEVEDADQLRIYAFAMSVVYPDADTFEVSLWHVRFGFEQGPFTYHREDLDDVREDLERRMAAADEAEAAGEFPATPGDQCLRCSYRRQCPAYRASARDEEIPDDPVELAQAFALSKARTKALESAVKDRCAEEPIALPGGKLLGFVGQDRVSIVDTEAAVTDLLENGVRREDLWRELNLSKTAAEKLLKGAGNRELIKPFLDAHGKVQTISVLKETKAGKGAA